MNALELCKPLFSSMQTQIATHLKVLKLRFMIVCLKKKGIKASQEGGRKCSFCRNSC